MAARVDVSSGEVGQAGDAGIKPELGPKPCLIPKPFSLQRNTTFRSILAPKTPEPSKPEPCQPISAPVSDSSSVVKLDAESTTIPELTNALEVPSAITPQTESTHTTEQNQIALSTSLTTPKSESPASTTSDPTGTSEANQVSLSELDEHGPSDTGHSATGTEPVPSPSVTSTPLQPQSENTVSEPTPAVVRRHAGKDQAAHLGGGRKRLSMELTSRFESAGLSLPSQPPANQEREQVTMRETAVSKVSVLRAKEEEKVTDSPGSPSEPECRLKHSTPLNEERDGEGVKEEGEKKGSSIQRRISLLLDSSSRPEALTNREEVPRPMKQAVSSGGVKQRIKDWAADTPPVRASNQRVDVAPQPFPVRVHPVLSVTGGSLATSKSVQLAPREDKASTLLHAGHSGIEDEEEDDEDEDEEEEEGEKEENMVPLYKTVGIRLGQEDGGEKQELVVDQIGKEMEAKVKEEEKLAEVDKLKQLELEERQAKDEKERERQKVVEREREGQREEEKERERQRQEEERKREEEEERKRQREMEREMKRQREEERDRERQRDEEERERNRKEEKERERQIELEKEREQQREEEERERKRKEEKERERQIELEKKRERQREEEERKIKRKEEERERLIEFEKERERQREEDERERKRKEEKDRERQIELEKERERQREEEERKRKEEKGERQREVEGEKERQVEEGERGNLRMKEERLREKEREKLKEKELEMEIQREEERMQEDEIKREEDREKEEAESPIQFITLKPDQPPKPEPPSPSTTVPIIEPIPKEEKQPHIEVVYDDFSVKEEKPLIKMVYDDFSVKPRRWGSQARFLADRAQVESPSPGTEEPESLGSSESDPQRTVVDTQEPAQESPVSVEPHPAERDLEGGVLTPKDGTENKEEGTSMDTEEVQLTCYVGAEEGRDTEALIGGEPDKQYGGCDTRLSEDDCRQKTEDQISPVITPDEPDSTSPLEETEDPLPFPEISAPLLDTSLLRARAELRKSRRTRPTRAFRQSSTTIMLEEDPVHDWRFYDSSDKLDSLIRGDCESDEEQPRGREVCSQHSQPQRIALFSGIDPSALKAQLKKRGGGGGGGGAAGGGEGVDTDRQMDRLAPSPSQLSRSPKRSSFLPGGSRVLPPVGNKGAGVDKFPSWLRELKSKKRSSQYNSEA